MTLAFDACCSSPSWPAGRNDAANAVAVTVLTALWNHSRTRNAPADTSSPVSDVKVVTDPVIAHTNSAAAISLHLDGYRYDAIVVCSPVNGSGNRQHTGTAVSY